MTNKEKAREIAENNACDYPFRGHLINTSINECEDSALEMANWKDEQYLEEKRELLGLVKMLPKDETNQTIIEDLIALLEP